MTNFNKAYKLLMRLEFLNSFDALHQNKGESGLTFMGIYEKAHPTWAGWSIIKQIMKDYPLLRRASKECSESAILREFVVDFYKNEFWDKMHLDKIKSEKIARHIFIFAVNAGCSRATKYTQIAVNAKCSGKMNDETLNLISYIDENKFCERYKEQMTKFYTNLAKNDPSKKQFLKGWLNRIRITDY